MREYYFTNGGVYYTLELSEEVVAKRFDSMFSGMQQADLTKNVTEATVKIGQQRDKHGTLHIKRFPESSTKFHTSRVAGYKSAYEREREARQDRIMQLTLTIDRLQRGSHQPGIQLQIRRCKQELNFLKQQEK